MSSRAILHAAAACSLAVALTCTNPFNTANAQTPEQFYTGRVVTILLGHPPGGLYDHYAQLAAPHLGRHIPGKPTVVVQHMPGGGGNVAAAHFANKAPRDGTMIAILPETLGTLQLMDPQFARWDVREMRYIGSFAGVTVVTMARKGAPAKTFEEMKTKLSNVGCSGRTTGSNQGPAILKYFTGVKFNIVCGYDSATAATLALIRGEVDMASANWSSWTATYGAPIKDGEIVPVLQFGLTREPGLENLPTAIELVDRPEQKDALAFFAAPTEIGRALIAPPGVPDDRFNALVAAFDELVKDPQFLADAERRGIPIEPKNAKQVAVIVDALFKAPSNVIELLAVARDKGFE